MDLFEQATQRSEGIVFPDNTVREQDIPSAESEVRVTKPVKDIPVSASIEAALSKSAPVRFFQKAAEEDIYYAPDDEDLLQYPELLQGVPENEHYKVLGQLSKAAAENMQIEIQERTTAERTQFANGTVVGMASELASYLDPVSVYTGGVAIKTMMKVPKFLRLGKMAQRATGGLTIGAISAAEERARQFKDVAADEDDVIYAAAAGMAMGGIMGTALAHGNDLTPMATHTSDRTKVLGKAIQKDLDDAVVLHPERDTRPMTQSDELYDTSGRDIPITDEVKEFNKQSTLTANLSERQHQVAARAAHMVQDGDVSKVDKGFLKTMLEKNPLITDGLRLLTSKSPVAKVVASHIGELATGARNGIATTSTMHKLIHETAYLKMIPVLEETQAKFLSARGIKQWNVFKYNGKGKAQFDEELMLELGRRYAGKASEAIDPHIKRAADAIDEATRRGLDDLKAAGWAGADEVKWKTGYAPLIWSTQKLMKVVNAGRMDDLTGVLTQAYTNVGMSAQLAKRLSGAIIQRKLKGAADMDFNPAALFSKASRGDLELILREGNVSELDIAGILKLTDRAEAGKMATRTNIDIGTEVNGLRVLDLIETDTGNLMSRWAQETGGRVGLAKKGITSFDDIDSYKSLVRTQAAAAGEDAEKMGGSVDAIFDTLLARPVNGGVSRNMRRLLDWSMVTKLGQLGFAQVAEMNNISAAHGLFQSLMKVPTAAKMYRQLSKAAKTGDFTKLDKHWMGELQVLGGQMYDEHLLLRPTVRLDETVDTGWMATMDNVMAMAQDKIGYVSGMYQVKGIEQTMVTMMQGDKIVRTLKGALNGKKLKRAGELGWGDKTIKRINENINKHVTYDRGVLDRLNLEQWDQLTRTEFISGMHRHVNQLIQRGFAGESSYWMHSDVAAMILQFRSFPLTAVEKQTGRHLLAGDAQTGLAMMYGMGWATTASMAKAYSSSIGRPDAAAYLEKRLSPEALIMQSMNYNPMASIGGDLIGAAASFTGMTSGASRGGGIIPPSISGLQQAYQGASNIVGSLNPLSDTKLTERGVRNTFSAMPLGTTIPMTWISNGLQQLVPKQP